MEPVVGAASIPTSRQRLLCQLCKQPYGACIQCAGHRLCFAAFHPCCARDAGLPMFAIEVHGGGEEDEEVEEEQRQQGQQQRQQQGQQQQGTSDGAGAGAGAAAAADGTWGSDSDNR
jgi:hypothetical protein